ncbi:RpiB/LacA/LacB family sugar-phosphate isomerase [bacterium]|nr:RpiB/LacA/LacB family sugar-phosphate isomerase [bacterium]
MNHSSSLESYCPLKATKMIGIAADQSGHELKRYLAEMLSEAGAEVTDFSGSKPTPAGHSPDFVGPLARAVTAGQVERGIAISGSGVGACIVANKVCGVRACLIHDPFSAHRGVEDDDLNLICLSSLVVGHALAWELIRIFLCARSSRRKPNQHRLEKVPVLENRQLPNLIFASVIALWTEGPVQRTSGVDLKRRALDQWENEGGRVICETGAQSENSGSESRTAQSATPFES